LSSRMVYGREHFIVGAVEFVAVKGFRAALIGGIRLYDHDFRI